MLHKAWNSKEEMPYCFPRSSIKFQGHTGQNVTDFDPNWAFRTIGRSQLSNPSDLPCYLRCIIIVADSYLLGCKKINKPLISHFWFCMTDLAQGCSKYIANALELLQPCTKLSINQNNRRKLPIDNQWSTNTHNREYGIWNIIRRWLT